MIVWLLDLTLHMQYMSLTTNVASSNPAHGEMYSIQHYVIKFVSDMRQVGSFHRILWLPPLIKLTTMIFWNIVDSGVKHSNPLFIPGSGVSWWNTIHWFVSKFCTNGKNGYGIKQNHWYTYIPVWNLANNTMNTIIISFTIQLQLVHMTLHKHCQSESSFDWLHSKSNTTGVTTGKGTA